MHRKSGRWPSLDPTKNSLMGNNNNNMKKSIDGERGDGFYRAIPHLEAATMEALSPPKQDRATARGMVQFITPNTWSANVCGRRTADGFKPKQTRS